MKRKTWIIVLAVVLLLAVVAVVCCSDAVQLRWALGRYQSAAEEHPEELTLTIYYMPATVLTRAPLTLEDLMNSSHTVKIEVSGDELAKHVDDLKKLDASAVQPVSGEYWLNARFHYVFERGDQKILEVTMECYGKDDEITADYALINGILVEKNTVLYEPVLPFLTQADLYNLGLGYLYAASGEEQPFGAE